MAICGSWVTDEEITAGICPCDAADFEGGEAELTRWLLIASQILYAATGRQFPGVCSDEIRPCCGSYAGVVQSVEYVAAGGSRPLVLPSGDCGGVCAIGCGCDAHASVPLPHRPVREIVAVTIDGVALDPSAYRLVDRSYVVKAEGSWPCSQDLGAPDDSEGTWSISYTYGVPPPDGGSEMAALYGCELAKGCRNDQDCQLPQRVQSVTREGFTMAMLDPFDFLEQNRTGLYPVDAWISAQNPHGISRPGKVLTPSSLTRSRRVR